jgi:5-formyltetrahydrofolate cyclo-ligase
LNLSEEKAAARKAALDRRRTADPSVTDAANNHLVQAVRSASGRIVSGYWPIRAELDPRPAMTALTPTHDLCLPVVGGVAQPLHFRRWTPEALMEASTFGTSVPIDPVEMNPSILIVPLAAFDARGYRLGYGGGFYDRTLENLRRHAPVTAIGFAYDIQRSDAVPIEVTDQPLDLIVTENGIIRPAV